MREVDPLYDVEECQAKGRFQFLRIKTLIVIATSTPVSAFAL